MIYVILRVIVLLKEGETMKVNKVSAYRKAIKMNQSQMAKLLNLSVDAYSRKERGLSEFKQSEMEKFANIISKKEPTATIEGIFFN